MADERVRTESPARTEPAYQLKGRCNVDEHTTLLHHLTNDTAVIGFVREQEGHVFGVWTAEQSGSAVLEILPLPCPVKGLQFAQAYVLLSNGSCFPILDLPAVADVHKQCPASQLRTGGSLMAWIDAKGRVTKLGLTQ